LGWEPVAFSEIEKFPSEVLKHHYPDVPNLGDMTKYKEWNFGTDGLDLLVGGTPCQSFSVAGLRKGIEDPRGNLALVYCGILDKFRPKWFVWENVPGVLSSGGGRDFGSLLGAMAELGYSCAYRVLDAQYFNVAQRRNRVFIVGHLGDWRNPAKVLFESDSLQRHTKPSRETREKAPGYVADSASALCARDYKGLNSDSLDSKAIVEVIKPKFYENHASDSRISEIDVSPTVRARWGTGGGNVPLVQAIPIHSQATQYKGGGKNRNDDGKGNGLGVGEDGDPCPTLTCAEKHMVAYGFEPGLAKREGNPNRFVEEMAPTLRANMGDNQVATAHAFKIRGGSGQGGKGYLGSDETAFTLATMQDQYLGIGSAAVGIDSYNLCETGDVTQTIKSPQGGVLESVGGVRQGMAIRKLTPMECERLQGFPDNYTNIKENCPDGPRYKAMGNSMAVPVMQWIGKRIQMVEDGLL
jgi:DNA (cytosine-5)-methyltransferase 1